MRVRGAVIHKIFSALSLLMAGFFAATVACAQSQVAADDTPPRIMASTTPADVLPLLGSSDLLSPSVPYTPPTESEKFHGFLASAVGPAAFVGASIGASVDQAFNSPHAWGQGYGAYAERVASNFGMGLISASSEYSLAEAFHEDTEYRRCTCTGFLRRFRHAAISTVAARHSDGSTSFSAALAASPFVGPMVAANTWIPSHDGVALGFRMGAHSLLGQFVQTEVLEFIHGSPHTFLDHVHHRFFKSF
jgi:hypothetical protein